MTERNKRIDMAVPVNQLFGAKSGLSGDRWSFYCLAVGLGIVLGIYSWVIAVHKGGDFATLYLADARFLHNQPIYSGGQACTERPTGVDPVLLKSSLIEDLAMLAPCRHPNLNPPIFILLTAPMAHLPFQVAWLCLFALSLTCFMVCLWLLRHEGLLLGGKHGLIRLGLAWLLYFPTLTNFFLGQVAFQVMLPLMSGWLALRRGQLVAAGVWLGLAASLKPFAGLFLPCLLMLGIWRATFAMLMTCLAFGLIGLLAGGWDVYESYFDALRTVNWQASSWNASLAGFFSRPFGGSENAPLYDTPGLAHALTSVVSLGVLAVLGVSVWRIRCLASQERADLLISLCLPAMLLLSPLGWLYYFPLLLPCVLILLRAATSMANPQQYRIALLATLLLSTMPNWFIPAKDMNDPLDWFGASGIYTIALLQFFALAAIRAYQISRRG